MISNKEADLYIENEIMNDTVNIYCDKLDGLKSDLGSMKKKVDGLGKIDWDGAGRMGFENEFNLWVELVNELIEEIDKHKNTIDEMLIDSAALYLGEKDIADDIE